MALLYFDTVAQPYLIEKDQKECPLELSIIMQVWRQEEQKDMTLKTASIGPIPSETLRVANAASPPRSLFMKMRDELGALYQDELFAGLFPHNGQPALAPWRLALVTIMQFVEELAFSAGG